MTSGDLPAADIPGILAVSVLDRTHKKNGCSTSNSSGWGCIQKFIIQYE
jgi:hypothetical protein